MASDSNKGSIVLFIAAIVGIGTAAYFILRKRRQDPLRHLDSMLDVCSSKENEIERLLKEGAQTSVA
jgi:hypothetical protein